MTGKLTEKFDGFPKRSGKATPLPATFFTDLLPLVDDLAELKVTLFCFWALYQKEGQIRYLRLRDFIGDDALMQGLETVAPTMNVIDCLDAALTAALERGTLLLADVTLNGQPERLYFVNTATGRTAVEQIAAGEWKPGDANNPIEILPGRPNIFHLYEDNFGPLTPMIADALKDAERDYPMHWIEDAMRLAVESNARSWRYVVKVLERWHAEGRSREAAERSVQPADGRRYVSGEYADFIEH